MGIIMRSILQNDMNRRRYFYLFITTLLIAAAMAYSYFSSSRMIVEYSPLIDATMEIKLEAATGHLWLEEVLTGDRTANIGEAIDHFDQAIWYAGAMLRGGENPEGKFISLDDPFLRNEVKEVLDHLRAVKDMSSQRHDALSTSGIGSDR